MITNKAHEEALRIRDDKINALERCLTLPASFETRTGSIKGVASRYILKAWVYPKSGRVFCILIHRHPGQSDMVILSGDYADFFPAYYAPNNPTEEMYAIRGLIDRLSAHLNGHFTDLRK